MPFPGQQQQVTSPPPYEQYPSSGGGESKSYASGQNTSPYPTYESPSKTAINNGQPQQQQQASEEGDRGLGSMLGGFMKPQHGYGQSSSNNNSGKSALGGAVAGALLT
jgi:hypothetical protein